MNRRRVWLWADEARVVTLNVPYERLSPRLHPIVIDFESLSVNRGLRGLVAMEHFYGKTDVPLYDWSLKVSAKL